MSSFVLKAIHIQNYHGISGSFEIVDNIRPYTSSIMLSAVQVLLSTYFKAFSTYIPDKYTIKLKTKDAMVGETSDFPCKVIGTIIFNDQQIEIGQELSESGRVKFIGVKELLSIVSAWEMKFSKADNSDRDILFPVILCCNPASYKVPKQICSRGVYHRLIGYKDCFAMTRSLEIPFSFLRMLRNVAFEERNNVDFPAYTKIMNVVNQVITDGTIIYTENFGSSLVATKKEDEIIPFEELPTDQQKMIGLVLDIVTRICILNPYAKDQALQKTPGIILLNNLSQCFSSCSCKNLLDLLQAELPNVQFLLFNT